MDQPRIQYARTDDDVSIAYVVLNESSRDRPVVYLNLLGSPLGLDDLLASDPSENLVSNLTAERSVVMFDWRGTGISGPAPNGQITQPGLLADLAAVVGALGFSEVDLLARGGPAHIAIEYAAKNPEAVARLAITQLSVPGVSPRNSPRFAQLIPIADNDWDLFSEVAALVGFGWQDIGFARRLYEAFRDRWDLTLWHSLMDVIEALDGAEAAVEVQCPALVYSVGKPPEYVRSVAARMPDARVVVGAEPYRGFSVSAVTSHSMPDDVVEFLRLGTERRIEPPSEHAFRTVLFTDVVASTPLLAELKDERMREVMRDHDEVLAAAVTGHGGRVVKTIGDAFMAEFAVPSAAVDAAVAAQRGVRDRFANSDIPIRLRIGINDGEPIEEDGDLHGASVVIAKRLESEADDGGILVSEVVRQAVAGKPFEFIDRGEVSLKGFDEPVRAWSLAWQG